MNPISSYDCQCYDGFSDEDFCVPISMIAFQILVIKMPSLTTLLAHMDVPVSIVMMVMV